MAGIVGCVVPGLPGPPLNYAGMLIVQYVLNPFEIYTLVVFGIVTVAVLLIDYLLPVWFARKLGATKQGIWGSLIGMVIGIIFTPIGMMIGLLLGAIIGDLIAGRTSVQATRSGLATFFGTFLSIGLKLGLAGVISVLIFYECVNAIWLHS